MKPEGFHAYLCFGKCPPVSSHTESLTIHRHMHKTRGRVWNTPPSYVAANQRRQREADLPWNGAPGEAPDRPTHSFTTLTVVSDLTRPPAG